jgi:hypothetical protein
VLSYPGRHAQLSARAILAELGLKLTSSESTSTLFFNLKDKHYSQQQEGQWHRSRCPTKRWVKAGDSFDIVRLADPLPSRSQFLAKLTQLLASATSSHSVFVNHKRVSNAGSSGQWPIVVRATDGKGKAKSGRNKFSTHVSASTTLFPSDGILTLPLLLCRSNHHNFIPFNHSTLQYSGHHSVHS